MLKRAEWTAAVLLTVAVGGLHLLRLLHAGGLWRDEAAAVGFATLPTVREVASSFQHEAFPLLFPLAVRGWAAVWGDRYLALRAFGAAVGLALAAALWWKPPLPSGREPAGRGGACLAVVAGFGVLRSERTHARRHLLTPHRESPTE